MHVYICTRIHTRANTGPIHTTAHARAFAHTRAHTYTRQDLKRRCVTLEGIVAEANQAYGRTKSDDDETIKVNG